MPRRDKAKNDSVITPEGESRLRNLVEAARENFVKEKKRWEASQKQALLEKSDDISNNISKSISVNISEKRRGFLIYQMISQIPFRQIPLPRG